MFRLLSGIVESMAGTVAEVVAYEPSCVVPDDPGQVVRHAAPLDDRARRQLLEQQIARLARKGAPLLRRAQLPRSVGNTRMALLRLRSEDRRQFQ